MPYQLVKLIIEESVHYSPTALEAPLEWLWTAPEGNDDVHLGPENRVFIIAMLHEMHCLRSIRAAVDTDIANYSYGVQEHLHHCFNYLRKWILCSADVTLEPGDFALRKFKEDKFGATHTCRDWEHIYSVIERNWVSWESFKHEHRNVSSKLHHSDGQGTPILT